VYEALAADAQEHGATKRYCVHLLADYITLVDVALPSQQASGTSAATTAVTGAAGAPAPPPTAGDEACAAGSSTEPLRRGVLHLVGCLGPAELQHLHVTLAPGFGGARRSALHKLRKAWEKEVKFAGKV